MALSSDDLAALQEQMAADQSALTEVRDLLEAASADLDQLKATASNLKDRQSALQKSVADAARTLATHYSSQTTRRKYVRKVKTDPQESE